MRLTLESIDYIKQIALPIWVGSTQSVEGLSRTKRQNKKNKKQNKKTHTFSHIQFFSTPRTVVCQATLSMRFPRQEYWNGLPFPSLGDIPDPGVKPKSPALAGEFFTTEPPGKSLYLSDI